MSDDIERARVLDDHSQTNSTLFSLSEYTGTPLSPAAVCRNVGMNWLAAQKLHEGGWLSFDPKAVSAVTVSQEAELRFVGALVATGCDEMMLPRLLVGLRKPYAYRLDIMYYSWQEQAWRLLLTDTDLKKRFASWIDALEESAELEKLEDLSELVERALRDVRSWGLW